jgi:hypothetical protein
VSTAIDTADRLPDERRLIRRAWLSIFAGLVIFLAILGSIVFAAWFYLEHATRKEVATLQIISGTGALIRSPNDQDYRLITGTTTVSEGDELSTTLGTVLWVTMFDGSTVEIAEDTIVKVSRMRSSRFLNSTKHIVLEPVRGTVYAAMAPRGEFRYSEFSVKTADATVTMADGNGSAGVGSFLVEVRELESAEAEVASKRSTRVAVLRGVAMMTADDATIRLSENQQVLIDDAGTIGERMPAVRQLIADGTFEFGLSNWVDFHHAGESGTTTPVGGVVELVNDRIDGRSVVAVELLRPSGDQVPATTGIRQRIGQTLRVYSSVRLEFYLKIAAQEPPGGGPDLNAFPFTIELNYVDILGEERQWTRHFYAIDHPDVQVPLSIGSRIDLNQWQHLIFDLHNLEPLPRQITSVVVYASGQSYQSLVTGLSLTSSELGESGQ